MKTAAKGKRAGGENKGREKNSFISKMVEDKIILQEAKRKGYQARLERVKREDRADEGRFRLRDGF